MGLQPPSWARNFGNRSSAQSNRDFTTQLATPRDPSVHDCGKTGILTPKSASPSLRFSTRKALGRGRSAAGVPGEGAVVVVVQRDSGGTGSGCAGGVRTRRRGERASARGRRDEPIKKNLKGSGAYQCINS